MQSNLQLSLKSFCALAAGCVVFGNATAAPPALQLQECRLESSRGSSASARCGWLTVPEDRQTSSNADAPTVRLHVAVIPALRLQPEKDPLVILAGGPGQGASDFYSAVSAAFGRVRRDRDILLVDQRGTGRSNRLDCKLSDDTDLVTVDPQLVRTEARTCLSELKADPRFYTTSTAVRDLEDVRAALGYERLNLYSVSYGTRVAQHYVRRYPSRVRTVILDGAVPVDLALGPDAALQAQRALDALFDRCIADAACRAAFPEVRQQFEALRGKLEREPLQVQLPDPVDAQLTSTSFGSPQLNAAVRLLTYSDETASVLPLLIHAAQTSQQPQALVAQYLITKRNMEAEIAHGMHFAVLCSEDAPRWARENIDAAALARTYMGTMFMTSLQAICEVWPRGYVDEDFSAPLQSDTPALLLSGSNDPVTPQEYGERALRSFKNGRHLVLAGQGHAQLANGCVPRVIAQFIAQGAVKDLDASCVEKVTPSPFMLSRTATGP